ncbi:MAG: hypothetical protein JWO88_2885 [Frankiales bacterium]|nr:hypothetical protein [Frankiales bacterium]
MDQLAVRAALRFPTAGPPIDDRPAPLPVALQELSFAARRKARADAEAARCRRPSTLKARLKATVAFELALEHARGHVRAELRLLDAFATVGQEPVRLRACG